MPDNISYTIIIVNHNGGILLRNCLESVFQHSDDFELILVDNDSTDGSDSEAAQLFPKTITVKNHRNVGFAKANNLGILRARGRWIVLLNPDTTVTPRWLHHLSQCIESSPRTGIATPKLLRPDEVTIDEAGLTYNFATGHTCGRGTGEIDKGQYDVEQDVISCSFACVVVKKAVFEDIGLLDEKMVLYFEDVDYCLRAWVAGWKVLYCPRSVVYHARGGLTPTRYGYMGKHAIAYRLRIMLKCYSRGNLLRFVPRRILRDVMAMAAGMKNHDAQYFLGYLRSPIWNILNPPVGERRLVQAKRRASDDAIIKIARHVR